MQFHPRDLTVTIDLVARDGAGNQRINHLNCSIHDAIALGLLTPAHLDPTQLTAEQMAEIKSEYEEWINL